MGGWGQRHGAGIPSEIPGAWLSQESLVIKQTFLEACHGPALMGAHLEGEVASTKSWRGSELGRGLGFPKNPVQTWCLTAGSPGEGSLSLWASFPTPSLSFRSRFSRWSLNRGPLLSTLPCNQATQPAALAYQDSEKVHSAVNQEEGFEFTGQGVVSGVHAICQAQA